MGELRVLERGTRVVSKERPCEQQYILIVDGFRVDPEEAWKGPMYHLYPATGGFEAVIREQLK